MPIMSFIRRAASYICRHGVMHTLRRTVEKAGDKLLQRYERIWRHDRADEATLAYQRSHPVEGVGRISIVVPVYNTDPVLMEALVNSFVRQTYEEWEACLYDGMSSRSETIAALDRLAQKDSRIIVRHGDRNDGISGNTNHAISMASGEWIALCDHDDLLEPDALYCMAEHIRDHQPDMLYSDEDFINASGKVHMSPHYKPDFNPDTLRAVNYICHLMLVRRSLLERIGGLRSDFDGSQDHDLALRVSEVTERIVHVPRVLYHWRQIGGSMSHQQLERCLNAGAKAVEEHITRLGWPGRVTHQNARLRIEYEVDEKASVRVFVLDDGCGTIDECLEAVRHTAWPDVTVQVLDTKNAPYRKMNAAAASAGEDYLVFLHGSVRMQNPDWLREMLMHAQRRSTGAVTAMITDSRGRIVHAGYALGVNHAVQSREEGTIARYGGWHSMLHTAHNVAAAAAGCVMIRRERFIPFDIHYEEGLGAADWSLRLAQRGLWHVMTPFSLGVCNQKAAKKHIFLNGSYRHDGDMNLYLCAWKNAADPCYSVHFNPAKANFTPRKQADKQLPC